MNILLKLEDGSWFYVDEFINYSEFLDRLTAWVIAAKSSLFSFLEREEIEIESTTPCGHT
jgi:hypothetical protein